MKDNGGGRSPLDDYDGDILLDYEYDAETPASIVVIQTLAALENVELTDITAPRGPLNDHVDPDALNQLLADDGRKGAIEVSFTLHGYIIHLFGDGSIRVVDPD